MPRGVDLRLIEPDKPNQNAYVESLNGRLRDECLNEHWFQNVLHARTVIETWRREYNEERPKKALGGLTPAAYAKRMAEIDYPNPGLQMAPLLKTGGRRFQGEFCVLVHGRALSSRRVLTVAPARRVKSPNHAEKSA